MPDLMDVTATCFEQVASFFEGGDPKIQESFAQRAKYLHNRNYSREVLVRLLSQYHQERLGAGSKTLNNINILAREDTLVVVTGQQAGFLTGPLYTLYKALTTIMLAEKQSKELGCPVVPVFWIASEDHDWAEIKDTFILNAEGKAKVCSLPGEGRGLSVGKLGVPSWEEEIYPELVKVLPENEYRSDILAQLRDFTEKAENLAEWFALTLQWLVHDQGLIFFDPMLPEVKKLAAPMFEQILKAHHLVREELQARTKKWQAQGYKAQIGFEGNEVNLFLAEPERRALLWNGEYFYLRGKNQSLSMDDLCTWLKETPDRFSANVVSRPVIQEHLLPVLAYVPGPGELNYWAQLGGVFSCLDMSMPILYPRMSVVILTSAWSRIMEAEGITVEDIYNCLNEHKERCIREQDDFDIEGRLKRVRQQISLAYRELEPLEEINKNIKDLLEQNQEKINGQLDYLEKKIWQAQRKRCDVQLKRLLQLEDGITPQGIKQERILNPLSFIARYGLEFVNTLLELDLALDFSEKQIVMKTN